MTPQQKADLDNVIDCLDEARNVIEKIMLATFPKGGKIGDGSNSDLLDEALAALDKAIDFSLTKIHEALEKTV